MNGICEQLQVPKRSYSISPYTANPIVYGEAMGSQVPITQHLFQEIREHIIYLANYIINNPTITATISQPDIVQYNYNNIVAPLIEQFRTEINNIEGEI